MGLVSSLWARSSLKGKTEEAGECYRARLRKRDAKGKAVLAGPGE